MLQFLLGTASLLCCYVDLRNKHVRRTLAAYRRAGNSFIRLGSSQNTNSIVDGLNYSDFYSTRHHTITYRCPSSCSYQLLAVCHFGGTENFGKQLCTAVAHALARFPPKTTMRGRQYENGIPRLCHEHSCNSVVL